MKKGIKILVFLFFMFIGVNVVNAAIGIIITETSGPDVNGYFTVKTAIEYEAPHVGDTFEITLNEKNIDVDIDNIELNKNFKVLNTTASAGDTGFNQKHVLLIRIEDTKFNNGDNLLTVKYKKTGNANDDCKLTFYAPLPITNTCRQYKGLYFDETNTVVDEQTYYSKCGCRANGNDYYDKTNTKVSEEQYVKACKSCIPYKGKYVKKDGTLTTNYDEYISSCGKKCAPDKDNPNIYYNENGETISKEEFDIVCGNFNCEIKKAPNGTLYYFNNLGTKVTKEQYDNNLECNQVFPVCGILNGKYYNSEKKEVTKEEFENDLKCNPVKCDIKDGKYYDNNGKEISKEEFDIQCNPHKCEKVGNVFFDNNGNQVSEDEYNKHCVTPAATKTGDILPIAYFAIAILFAGSLLYYSKKHTKLN